ANLQVIPMTEAKKDIQQVNKSPVENFVVKYLKQLKQGMECNLAVDYKSKELTEFQFKAQLKDICNYERKNAPKCRIVSYVTSCPLRPQEYEWQRQQDVKLTMLYLQ
ncbi:MAG: hypothetical protein EZS28_032765, partial [Streblomastix strix]